MALQSPGSGPEKGPSIGEQLAALNLFQSKVTDEDRLFFTEQLVLLLETGSSLHEGLRVLAEQIEAGALKNMVENLAGQLEGGASFAQALSHYPDTFDESYIHLVAASERGGFLNVVLSQIYEMEIKRQKLKETLGSALSYPLFLLAFSFAVTLFVLIQVFPKFKTMFSSMLDQLPPTTRFFMTLSDSFNNHGLIWLSGTAALLVAVVMYIRSGKGQRWLDSVTLKLPVLKHVFIQLYLIQSMRVMGLSIQNGVSVPDTLDSCRGVVSNDQFKQLINRIEQHVQDGHGLAHGFIESPLIPSLVKYMLQTGERSAQLAKVMLRIADHYERELDKKVTGLSKMAEPLMLVVMGILVGVLVSSLILPIFQLSTGAR